MLKIPILFLALTTSAYGAIDTIYTLPFTVTTDYINDTLIIDTDSTHLHAGGRAITINANVHDVLFALGTDTISWNTGFASPDSVGRFGIFMAGGSVYNIVIDSGYIIEAPPNGNDSSIAVYGDAVRMSSGNHDITIQNTFFKTIGRNSQAVYNESPMYNLLISNCTFQDSVTAFRQRDLIQDNVTVCLQSQDQAASLGGGFSYNMRVTGSDFTSHWGCIQIHGDSAVGSIDSNTFTVDAYNNHDTSATPEQGSASQCYAIYVRGDGTSYGRVRIFDNDITAGTSKAGCRGIFLSGLDGIAADSINVYDNTISVHQGFDEETRNCNGMIVRGSTDNVRIYNNNITVTGDTSSGLGTAYSYGTISGIRVTQTLTNLTIRQNTIATYMTGNWTPNYTHDGTGMHAACIVFDAFPEGRTGIVIDSNTFRSNSVNIRWGFTNGHGGNVTMFANTFDSVDVSNQDLAYMFYLGYGAGETNHAYDNWIINPTMSGAVVSGIDTIFCDDSEPDSLSIGLQVIYELTVNDAGVNPVSGADAWIVNNYGDTVALGTTDASGLFSDTISYWWESNDTFSEGDSTGFNNFTLGAQKGGDTTTATTAVGWNNKDTTMVLLGTGVNTFSRFVRP